MKNSKRKKYLTAKSRFLTAAFNYLGRYPTILMNRDTENTEEIRLLLPSIKEVFNSFIPEELKTKYGIVDISNKCRKQKLVNLKQLYCLITRHHFQVSYSDLGNIIYQSDHTDAIHAFNKALIYLEVDNEFKELYKNLLTILSNDTRFAKYIVKKQINT